MFQVELRYWAGAETAAGTSSERFRAASVASGLDQALAARPGDPEFARVLRVSSLLVDGRRLADDDRAAPLTRDVVCEVLPPFAGG